MGDLWFADGGSCSAAEASLLPSADLNFLLSVEDILINVPSASDFPGCVEACGCF